MQISRHWRLNQNRYRLAGYAADGVKSLQERPVVVRKPQEAVATTAATTNLPTAQRQAQTVAA
ncbi:MAG: hypothetical protein MUC99_08100 [Anaerolineae bacterium]|jgi:hypothetical protein|nr:hypothetical protein [Anaerolineae bacterium]